MAEAKPGPWTIDDEDVCSCIWVRDANGRSVCTIIAYYEEVERHQEGETTIETRRKMLLPEAMPTARLIAAAPAMRDALRAIVDADVSDKLNTLAGNALALLEEPT